ncbi:MAG: hypothetical protein HC834_06865 [Rhodospirillales bacterium]|nr:hypothetical protein [Rhodospirillales bacterium]
MLWFDGSDKEHIDESWFQNRFLGCFPREPHQVYSGGSSNVAWAGVQNQFFAMLTLPETPADRVTARRFELPPPTAAELEANPKRNKKPMGHQGGLIEGELVLAAGATAERNFTLYAGPKEYNTLSKIALERQNHLDVVMNFSGFFGFFAKGLLLSMNTIHNNLVVGYGLAIVFITVIIKLVFWPLTNASTKSMKRMAKLQPEMKALQEKYKDDPQKDAAQAPRVHEAEQGEPHGFLPAVAAADADLHRVLHHAPECDRAAWCRFPVDLRPVPPGHAVLPARPGDPLQLDAPDHGRHDALPGPVDSDDPGMDPVQQKMMRYMPLIFVLFLYSMSSALTLYWTVQNILSIVQTKLTRTDDDKPKPVAPAAPVASRPAAAPQKKKR